MRKQVYTLLACSFACSTHAALANAVTSGTAGADSARMEQLATGDMPIPTAVSFPVIFKTSVDSKRAHTGDVIEAVLKEDLLIDDQVIAQAGSILVGHLEESNNKHAPRKGMRSVEARFSIPGKKTIRLLFDEIVTSQKECISIVGVASKQKINVIADGVMRNIVVGNDGELEPSERIIKSGRKLLAAAIPRNNKNDRAFVRANLADIEVGDEIIVQAHSPYEAVKVSAR